MTFNVKQVRIDANMSQTELAKKSNVSRGIISGLENGTITVTSTETLRKLADALGKKVSDIFLD
ncbi:MAG: helix-turn-helix transcriptional regulator [Lachnospiraceae bacterium]|nr:helix-turn-helix transcriptional regulator [Lachnospiraceae bacterium]MBQ9701329.1 helix-turn-helix transcriptional regulator [Lachnospiraceae bacterium]